MKSQFNLIFSTLKKRHCCKEPVLEFEDKCIEEEEQDVLKQFLKTQKNKPIDLQDHLGIYCNVLPIYGFNSAKYDVNLIKRGLLPLLVNERGFEPISLYLSSLGMFNC